MKILDLKIGEMTEARIKLGWLNEKVILFPTRKLMLLITDPEERNDILELDLSPMGLKGVSEFIKQRCLIEEKVMAEMMLKAADELPKKRKRKLQWSF